MIHIEYLIQYSEYITVPWTDTVSKFHKMLVNITNLPDNC